MSKNDRCVNFAPGPAVLPLAVLETIEKELYDWRQGMSVMECSHRSKEVIAMVQETEELLRSLLNIPSNYHLLFVPGGARTQFSAIPLNCLQDKKAFYINTGTWSRQACKEAKRYGEIDCVDDVKITLPDSFDDYAYVHYTDNETIEGFEFASAPNVGPCVLISDMTSNLMTKKIDVSQFGLIYAAAQKNLGIAGITLVIIREDLMGHAHPMTPLMLNYKEHDISHSLLNTMPVFPMYVMNLMCKWLTEQGGVAWAGERAEQWASSFYEIIDNSCLFKNSIEKEYRSRINIPFQFESPELEQQFLIEAQSLQLMNLKGHASVGGIRISLYLGMTEEGVNKLIQFMRAFDKRYG